MKKIIAEILKWLNAIAKDKYQHYSLGALIAGTVFGIVGTIGCILTSAIISIWLSLAISILAVVGFALWKEYYYDGMADLKDVYATVGGGATVWLVIIVALLIIHYHV